MKPSHTPELLLVDDHKLVVAGLCSLLAARYRITIAYNLQEMREKLAAQRFDLALLDLQMEDGNPSKSYREMLNRCTTPILIVASSISDAELWDCNRGGVRGYLAKNLAEDEFERAVEKALQGEAIWDEKARSRLKKFNENKPQVPKRVIPIIKHLLAPEAPADKAIAQAVGLKTRTVNNYMQLLFDLYGVKLRHQLIAKLNQMGYTKDLLPEGF